jgi:hypothetical protein
VVESSESLVFFISVFLDWLLPLRILLSSCLLLICFWTIISSIIDIVERAKQMHRVPCTHCRFFTRDYRLKCTVQPHIANTENAIDCSDYRPR